MYKDKKKKLHIVGTHGVPARYGGFELLADYLVRNLSEYFNITVYCNAKKYPEKNRFYYNARLIYLPLDASGGQGIIYDILSFIHALFFADAILFLSPVGSGFMTVLNIFFRKKIIVNHGGLNEWEREKLSPLERKWVFLNHWVATRFCTVNVVDNELYKKSLKDNFDADAVVIKYGADHVHKEHSSIERFKEKYNFSNNKYAVSVSRAQLDNNIHIVLESFAEFTGYKIVLVSNWGISGYGKGLYEKYRSHPNMILLNAIYDQEEIDFIRGNAHVYIHSHSRCGTAPSLIEAMYLGLPIISFDVPVNRFTTENKAEYFANKDDLIKLLRQLQEVDINANANEMLRIAFSRYVWKTIAEEYRKILS